MSELRAIARCVAQSEQVLIEASLLCADCPELLAVQQCKTATDLKALDFDAKTKADLWALMLAYDKAITAMAALPMSTLARSPAVIDAAQSTEF